MEYFLTVLWTAFDILAVFLIGHTFLSAKRDMRFRVNLYCITWLLSSILTLSVNGGIRVALCIGVVALAFWILLDGKWPAIIAVAVLSYLFATICEFISFYGATFFLGMDYEQLVKQRMLYAVFVTSEKSLTLFAAWLLYAFFSKRKTRPFQAKWVLLSALFPTVSVILLYSIFFQAQERENLTPGAMILCVGLAAANVGILFGIQALEKSTQKEREAALMRQQITLQSESITALEKSYRAQRKATHDFGRHLETIQELLKRGDLDSLQEYLDDLQKNHTTRIFSIRSGNPVIDVVLNEKYQAAQEKGVAMQFQVNDLKEVTLRMDALAVVLSNLLDNAIEAAEKCSGWKEIQCVLKAGPQFYLSVRNTSSPVSIIDGKIATTKPNPLDHGYGLPTVCGILSEWGAEYSFDYSDGWFQFVAEIPMK